MKNDDGRGKSSSFSSVHRNEILAAAIHEYTEWERPVQHPISVRDETLDALGDAQVKPITDPLPKAPF